MIDEIQTILDEFFGGELPPSTIFEELLPVVAHAVELANKLTGVVRLLE